MSRRKPPDNSASVSLFPFLAVLLCTMGALLVVLVAVSRSARNAALQRAQARQQAVAAEENPDARAELDKLEQYTKRLKQVRGEAEKRLREDQLRLSQLENHMRSLQDELQKLVLAGEELDALDQEHYDDRKQAERERNRLHQLIAEKQTAIEQLKNSAAPRKRAYALVPYEGPNGTLRRPIYVECCKEGLVLQPEGVVIRREDLRPPLGSGNALASALRAARDHYIQTHPDEGTDRDTEPYPMLLIRPEGADLFGLARRAIEAADFDFGFEPVESHWELNYGVPDPVLANVEQQALDQARARQELLAAAAPRAYRNPELGSSGRFEYDDEADDELGLNFGRGLGGGSGGGGTSSGQSIFVPSASGTGPSDSATSVGSASRGVPAPDNSVSGGNRYGTSAGNGGAGGSGDRGTGNGDAGAESADASQPGGTSHGDADNSGGGTQMQAAGPRQGQSNAADSSAGGTPSSSMPEEGAGFSTTSGAQASVAMGGSPNDVHVHHQRESDSSKSAGVNWKAPRANVRAVAVRRTIRIVVRGDHIGILSDESRSARSGPVGKTIPFKRDTVESMDEFVEAVENQVEAWGIAGDNLYWKPVLEIQVGPDGGRRAEDMARLLKNSDIEVKLPATANNPAQGDSRATR
ncbi:MAG: hypothetical protein L0228_18620 [Planctomycetes bacterium]|nr:hypothetical protein [Planctomycetota bacterium]